MEVGLILLVVTLFVNFLARMLLWSVTRKWKGGVA